MKKIIQTTGFALSLLLLPLIAFAAPMQYQVQIDGLACPFCAYGIEKGFNNTKGVESIDIDINAGTVTVTMTDGATLTEAQAKQIVKDAGFTIREFNALQGTDASNK